METDQRLVERVLAGDRRAFRDLVLRHERLVGRLVLRMVPDLRDQQELCQDVFVRVHARLADFRFEAKLSTWIASIAYRACLNHLKSRRGDTGVEGWPADHEHDGEPPIERVPDGALSQLDSMQAAEARRFIQEQVKALPPHFRAAITLFHLEDMSLAEIALGLGLAEGTVKSHLFRARRILKDRLVEHHLARTDHDAFG